MSQTAYTFDVRSLDHPGVLRTIELRGDQTLADLHGVMEEEFGLDDEHLWAFYLSGEWYDRDSELGRSGRAHDVELRSLGLEPGLRIAHLHDFGEEWRHVVDLTGVGEVQPEGEYPRVVARVGVVAQRSRWDGEDEEEGEGEPFAPDLIAAIREAISTFYADDPDARALALQPSAATIDAALDACATKGRLQRLGRCVEGPFPAWVHDVALQLGRSGSSSRALALVERIASLLGYERFPTTVLGEALEAAAAWDEIEYEAEIGLPAPRLAELVHALCSTVRTPERVEELSSLVGRSLSLFLRRAVEQLAAAREVGAAREAAGWLSHADASPGELVTLAHTLAGADLKAEASDLLAQAEAMPYVLSAHDAHSIAQGYVGAGDDAAAEARLRRIAGRRWITARDRDAVVGLLAEILERTGRASEARAVEAEHAAWHRGRLEARGGTVRRTEPRVGRNDPCPCGSGRKFKKCCGSGQVTP